MLYLAQVHQGTSPTEAGFRLLALQEAEDTWVVFPQEEFVPCDRAVTLCSELLVLVDITSDQIVSQIQDAKPWILKILQQYLSLGITPEALHQEVERAEQWRQSLTLQSQELDRRALELEARREQIQSLEEDLTREKKKIEG
ncbi:MAG: hypothetical protein VKJ24_03900 [Synechococcales bacterium]|nr:hypothetical protein [Synechococcales bacterium]